MFKNMIHQGNCVLIFDHKLGGGTNKYTKEILLKKHKYVVRVIQVSKLKFVLECYESNSLIFKFSTHSLQLLIDNYFKDVKFEVFYINHLISFYSISSCIEIITSYAKRTVYFFHDYFAVCPSYNLIDYNGVYCGGETDLEKCNYCIKKNNPTIHNFRQSRLEFADNISNWRYNLREILRYCGQVICFSDSSYQIVVKIFPDIANRIEVKPHKLVKPLPLIQQKTDFSSKQKLNIGILGRLSYPKGSEIVKPLSEKQLFLNHTFNLIVIGHFYSNLSSNYKVTGEYNTNNLEKLARTHNIDLFINTSIWPETYCYAADEVMSMGFPLVSFDIGAHAERIKSYQHGFLVKEINADEMYKGIIKATKYYGFRI